MSQERTAKVVGEIFDAIREIIARHRVTYEEFDAAKQYVIEVGETGEWPLFADVFFEAAVERVAAESHDGSDSTIEGPYYVPGAPVLEPPYTMKMRSDEPGERLMLAGKVAGVDGAPIAGALLDAWQADCEGRYSFIQEGLPEYNLRSKFTTDENGEFELRTVLPAPYEIPKAGPTGKLLAAAGWHAWRPAHMHFIVTADGYEPLTTQLFFEGGEWVDSDVADAVKPGLVLTLERGAGSDPHPRASYEFRLVPAAG